MANRRSVWLCLPLLALWCLTTLDGAEAQTTSLDALKSEIYFGSNMGDGQTVSQQAWEEFLGQVIVPRFPTGLTKIDASGSGGIAAPFTRTRVLVLVHANGDDAQARFSEIKAEYKKRFGKAGVFHTDQPVRIHNCD